VKEASYPKTNPCPIEGEEQNVYEMLEQELQVMMDLDHPNIIKIH